MPLQCRGKVVGGVRFIRDNLNFRSGPGIVQRIRGIGAGFVFFDVEVPVAVGILQGVGRIVGIQAVLGFPVVRNAVSVGIREVGSKSIHLTKSDGASGVVVGFGLAADLGLSVCQDNIAVRDSRQQQPGRHGKLVCRQEVTGMEKAVPAVVNPDLVCGGTRHRIPGNRGNIGVYNSAVDRIETGGHVNGIYRQHIGDLCRVTVPIRYREGVSALLNASDGCLFIEIVYPFIRAVSLMEVKFAGRGPVRVCDIDGNDAFGHAILVRDFYLKVQDAEQFSVSRFRCPINGNSELI